MQKLIAGALAATSLIGAVAVVAAPTEAAAQPGYYRHHGYYGRPYYRHYGYRRPFYRHPYYGHGRGYGYRHRY